MTRRGGTDHAVRLDRPLRLERGGAMDPCTIGLRRIGCPDAPAVLVLGGISATRRVTSVPGETTAGWWEPVLRASRLLSGGRLQLIGADYLAGEGLSSTPGTGQSITTGDQAEAIVAACRAIGIGRLAIAIGASYGGMVALALAERRPDFVGHVVAISAADRSHPMASAGRWIQREILRLGEAAGRPQDGVALARALAMTSYRTAGEFRARFGAGDSGARSVAAWLEQRGADFAARWTPSRCRQLSESLDLHSVEPSRIATPVTLIAVPGDTLVPLWQLQQLRARLGGSGSLQLLESPYGHDAFLKEPAAVARLLDCSLTSFEAP